MNAGNTVLAIALVFSCFSFVFGVQKPQMRSGKLVLALKSDAADLPSKYSRTIAVIKNRCIRFRIRCEIGKHNNDGSRLSIRFSSTKSLDNVKELLLGEGLQVRAVDSKPFPTQLDQYVTREAALQAAGGKEVVPLLEPDRQAYLVLTGPSILTGDDLRNCRVFRDQQLMYGVDCHLRPHGAIRLENWTGANINRYIAVVLNGEATSVGYIKAPISLNMEIYGIPARARAQEVAHIFESGNLPPLDIVEEIISP